MQERGDRHSVGHSGCLANRRGLRGVHRPTTGRPTRFPSLRGWIRRRSWGSVAWTVRPKWCAPNFPVRSRMRLAMRLGLARNTISVHQKMAGLEDVGAHCGIGGTHVLHAYQPGRDRGCRRRPKTKYDIGTTPAELASATTAAHIHFRPRSWLAGRRWMSMSAATRRAPRRRNHDVPAAHQKCRPGLLGTGGTG